MLAKESRSKQFMAVCNMITSVCFMLQYAGVQLVYSAPDAYRGMLKTPMITFKTALAIASMLLRVTWACDYTLPIIAHTCTIDTSMH
jgi:hypothetical protein